LLLYQIFHYKAALPLILPVSYLLLFRLGDYLIHYIFSGDVSVGLAFVLGEEAPEVHVSGMFVWCI